MTVLRQELPELITATRNLEKDISEIKLDFGPGYRIYYRISGKTGLNRETLHRTLSRTGNPTLKTLQKIVDALGLKLQAEKT